MKKYFQLLQVKIKHDLSHCFHASQIIFECGIIHLMLAYVNDKIMRRKRKQVVFVLSLTLLLILILAKSP